MKSQANQENLVSKDLQVHQENRVQSVHKVQKAQPVLKELRVHKVL
jgi:hypothetical protein